MGYWLTLIGSVLTVLGAIFTLFGLLISPKDNIFQGPKSIFSSRQDSYVEIKDSPGAVVNVNQTQINYITENLTKEGATKIVTDKLIEISKIIKEGRFPEAETSLRNFKKQNLNQVDLTNIQSVRAGLYLIQGKLPEAKAVYEAILDTQIKSNAVYIGLATISAFEAFGKKSLDPKESIRLFYQSNDWYFKAVDIDKRPQVLAMIYYGIYDNFRFLVNFFQIKKEEGSLNQYKALFEQYNREVGYPVKVTSESIGMDKGTNVTKAELVPLNTGVPIAISRLPVVDNGVQT